MICYGSYYYCLYCVLVFVVFGGVFVLNYVLVVVFENMKCGLGLGRTTNRLFRKNQFPSPNRLMVSILL